MLIQQVAKATSRISLSDDLARQTMRDGGASPEGREVDTLAARAKLCGWACWWGGEDRGDEAGGGRDRAFAAVEERLHAVTAGGFGFHWRTRWVEIAH